MEGFIAVTQAVIISRDSIISDKNQEIFDM